jgi:hypothetical protein
MKAGGHFSGVVFMHAARCLVVLSAFLLIPAQAKAQDEWEQQVLEQIGILGDVLSSDGFSLNAETPRGSLKSEASESFTLTLESGLEYLLVGACDVDCTDIDLIVFDEAGNDVDSDYEEDDAPVLPVTPSRTQTYQIHVYMANCTSEPCWYAVGVFARRRSSDGPLTETGSLASGDRTLDSGEYYDTYSLSGTAGDFVVIDLRSSDFDPYLMLVSPSRENFENDDYEGDAGRSRVAMELPETGDYIVGVTSYKADETGAYELSVDLGAADPTSSPQREIVELAVGNSVIGRLEPGDRQMDTGEYGDVFVFDGNSGESVDIEMTSSDFDTYLVLITPSGDQIENDDYDNQSNRSRIDLALRETGRYSVVTTSYKGNETGDYQLALTPSSSGSTTTPLATSRGRVYGVFAGISDYPGEADDLVYTAEDAHRVRDALARAGMRNEDAIILTDEAATIGAVNRAFSTLADRMGPDDTFIFFYSGHGNRIPRSDFQPSDPDAMDETIELYDGPVTDDQMSEMLTGMNAGTSIVVLDACFSGGFAKDVISVPGRMGFFSSEEDVTSSVAAKFRAGGYLAMFLADAVGDGLADGDDDGGVSALELSQYLHERYRADVKSTGSSEIVRTGGPQLGYQHLVVDRGSISPYDVLFYFDRGTR